MTLTVFSRISTGMAAATLFVGLSTTLQAQDFIKGERPQQRGYSLAVITEGGKTVWLAGQTATADDSGKRSEERRVGKECRSGWSQYDEQKKQRRTEAEAD